MRIAQVAPLYESVPPKLYGGTERVVSYLSDELVRLGHDVTLFASGDSITRARLIACGEHATRLDPACRDELAPHVLQLELVIEHAAEFDVIHFHHNYLHWLITDRIATPHVTTLHGRLDHPYMQPLYARWSHVPVVSISEAQRRGWPDAAWFATVHHGLPRDLYRPELEPGDYFAFLGRVSPEKGLEQAIEIATALGMPLKIAAKVDRNDRCFFRERIEPLLRDPRLEFVGEIDEPQKNAFLSKARALLFPIRWPEPFGLVVIEALACGTPVIAFGQGSIPELIDHGESGFVVHDVPSAIAAATRLPEVDRRRCRAVFERRFSASRMARHYLTVYRRLIDRTRNHPTRGAREVAA